MLVWQSAGAVGRAAAAVVTVTVVPVVCVAICVGAVVAQHLRAAAASARCGQRRARKSSIWRQEAQQAVGLVIQRDQFPDRLFAPPKRDDFLDDGANPVYDKEMRSEIFSQGTLMLRLVIQVSMFLAIPLMAVCLYIWPQLRAVVHQLRGAVQHAGRAGVFGRQRHQRARAANARSAADDDHHAVADPVGQAALGPARLERADAFLLWPVLLACVMVSVYWTNLPTMVGYLLIVLMTCLTTAMMALFCSVLFQKTSISLMTTYLVIILLFARRWRCGFSPRRFFHSTRPGPWSIGRRSTFSRPGSPAPSPRLRPCRSTRVVQRPTSLAQQRQRRHGSRNRRLAALLCLRRFQPRPQCLLAGNYDVALQHPLASGGVRTIPESHTVP